MPERLPGQPVERGRDTRVEEEVEAHEVDESGDRCAVAGRTTSRSACARTAVVGSSRRLMRSSSVGSALDTGPLRGSRARAARMITVFIAASLADTLAATRG
jgi:hypothetical protein